MNSNACPKDDDAPFSLVCLNCDAGMDIPTLAAAIKAGWTDIQYCTDLPQANYLGLCRECRAGED